MAYSIALEMRLDNLLVENNIPFNDFKNACKESAILLQKDIITASMDIIDILKKKEI